LIGKKSQEKIITFAIPKVLKKLLEDDKKAETCFLKMSPSHQKEYINYITEAKKEETQLRRAEKVMEMVLNKSIQK